MAQSEARAYPLLFAFLFLPYVFFNHSDGWNQGARLAQLHAVVLQQTLRIDAYHHVTGDKALINGHYYSEKAPAISLLALPAFAATVSAQRALGIDPDAPRGWRVSEWIATAGSVALVAALGGVAFFALLRRRMNRGAAFIATVALFLGSLAWPYATALFAHAGTIGLMAIVLWTVFDPSPASSRKDYLGGLAAGLAIASEYPAVFPIAALGVYVLATGFARALRFGIAMLPALALILLNNYLTTGSPFTLSYGSNAAFPEISAGNFFGFTLPSPRAAAGLLWGEYRGLFFWCPALLMAPPGLVELSRTERGQAVVVIAATALTLLQAASFSGWTGGNAIGPRYLTPAIPLLGYAAAHGIKRLPKVGAVLTAASVSLMGMVTAIAIDPSQDVAQPLAAFYLVRIEQDRFAANLGTLIGLPPRISLIVLASLMVILAWLVIRETATVARDAA